VSAKALPREEAMLMIFSQQRLCARLGNALGLCRVASAAVAPCGSSIRTMRTYYLDDVQNLWHMAAPNLADLEVAKRTK
jgi:hypothetical protein